MALVPVMDGEQELRRCRECDTVFEARIADASQAGEPRCPQCFLAASDAVGALDSGETVIRQSTPFR